MSHSISLIQAIVLLDGEKIRSHRKRLKAETVCDFEFTEKDLAMAVALAERMANQSYLLR